MDFSFAVGGFAWRDEHGISRFGAPKMIGIAATLKLRSTRVAYLDRQLAPRDGRTRREHRR